MKDTDENWIIQWRYNRENQRRPEVLLPWEPRVFSKRWHACAYFPEKKADYLYSVQSTKKATRHTLEHAMELWYMMRNNWKFDETTRPYSCPRLVRLYNVNTKEEVYPAQIDPGCIDG